jgi:hypothetical protein
MALKDDPNMALVNAWLPRLDADALIGIANAGGISRSELLRRTARGLIEQHGEREHE